MKKLIIGIIVTIMMIGIVTMPVCDFSIGISVEASKEYTKSDVKNGWYTSNGKKFYYEDGNKVTSKTKKIDGKIYLFGKKGDLLQGGIYTVNDSKYRTDDNGVVMCNKWVNTKKTSKSSTYYYAESTGKITEYSFKPERSTGYSIYNYYNLYINDKLATEKDLKKINTKADITYDCFYRFDNDYYYIWAYSSKLLRVMCSGTANLFDNGFMSSYMYDFGSGKYLGEYYGVLKTNSKGICSGNLFNKNDGYIYQIRNNGTQTTKYKAGTLVITESKTSLNSVGGVDYSLSVVNNSPKTIKYIHYKVYVKNAVGDIVYCTITDESYFNLKDTGPYKPGEVSFGGWEAIMYNYSGKQVVISSVTIDYTDGTSITLNGNQISSLV